MNDTALLAQFPECAAFLFKPARYKVMYGGRGGLKSWSMARALLIMGVERSLRVLCARETMESISQSVHRLLWDQIVLMGLEDEYIVEKAQIRGRNNDTLFTFAGLAHNITNIKSLESYDICWVEEAQSVSEDSWTTLTPTIRKENSFGAGNHSEIWVSFNPDLETDATYVRFVINKPSNAVVKKTSYEENPWFPEPLMVEMEDMKKANHAKYLHVYCGECKASVEGAIFEQEMLNVDSEKRICNVPYNPAKPVYTVWDLGFQDMVAVWFVQLYAGQYHFIDYMEDSRKTIHDYMVRMQQKSYVYQTVFLPYDGVDTIIHKRLAGSREMSIEQIMREAGYQVRIVPKVYITDRLNAARTIFPLCRFDERKCVDGLSALRRYQWPAPNKLGVVAREPLHDAASHASEAFTRAGQILPTIKDVKVADKIKKFLHMPVSGGVYAPFG